MPRCFHSAMCPSRNLRPAGEIAVQLGRTEVCAVAALGRDDGGAPPATAARPSDSAVCRKPPHLPAALAQSCPQTSRGDGGRGMEQVSILRLYVMRITYAIIVIGLAALIGPVFLARGSSLNHMHGVVCAMLSAVAVLAAVGIRYPLKMVLVLLFELIWKVLWMLVVALPQYLKGAPLAAPFAATVVDNTFGIILVSIAIPWGYVWRHYAKASGDPWRRPTAP